MNCERFLWTKEARRTGGVELRRVARLRSVGQSVVVAVHVGDRLILLDEVGELHSIERI